MYIFVKANDIILKTEYSEKTKMLMVLHHSRLSEKDRRQYAAIEALKLGRGGITYISKVLGVDRDTVSQGAKELLALMAGASSPATGRQRRPGGGRKKNGKISWNSRIAGSPDRKTQSRQPYGWDSLLDKPKALADSWAFLSGASAKNKPWPG